jgi:hypothetical protein
MAIHVSPSMLMAADALRGAWSRIYVCTTCGARTHWMDIGYGPCAHCGEQGRKEESAKWTTEYAEVRWWRFRFKRPVRQFWMLRSEAADKLPAWKNPESPEFDARRVAREQLEAKP